MINSGQKNRLQLSHKKATHVDVKNAKPTSTKKPLNKGGISQSKSKKNLTTSGEHTNMLIKSGSIHKRQSNFSNDKTTKMITHSQSCQLLRSKSRSKQFISKDQKTKQKKKSPYILNPLSNSKSHNSLSLNREKQNSSSHIKTYSNHTSTKNISNQSYDMSLFTKSTDVTKMKKKSHNYIKSFNKTTIQNKGCSKLENIQSVNISRSCKSGKMRTNTEGLENIRQFQITDAQLDGANLEFCPKISQIRQNVNNLFKKLKQPIRNKLLLITNNYEKIVSQLYEKINNNKPNQPPIFDLSNIQYTHSISGTDEQSKVGKENIVKIKDFSPSTSAMYEQCSESEHWDSYLEAEQKGKKENMHTKPVSLTCNKQNLVKKLNLGDVKMMQIKQYQDQFMENQQVFSDSWKRQINQQKRF